MQAKNICSLFAFPMKVKCVCPIPAPDLLFMKGRQSQLWPKALLLGSARKSAYLLNGVRPLDHGIQRGDFLILPDNDDIASSHTHLSRFTARPILPIRKDQIVIHPNRSHDAEVEVCHSSRVKVLEGLVDVVVARSCTARLEAGDFGREVLLHELSAFGDVAFVEDGDRGGLGEFRGL